MVFNNSILLGAAGQGGAAPFDSTLIGNSVWLDGSDDDFDRSTTSHSSTECVMSCWFQLNTFTTGNIGLMGLGTGNTGSNNAGLWFSGNALYFYANGQGSVTTQLFRDIGWYHILGSWKLDESGTDKGKLFINGSEVTNFSDDRRTSWGTSFGSTATQSVGSNFTNTFLTGYIAQPIMLDGQSVQGGDVAITDFVDTFTFGTNGSQVIPKKNSEVAALASSAGGNSFCLDFADSTGTGAANLGNDISSNNKDLTVNGTMSSANQSESTPSNTYATWNAIQHPFPTTSGSLVAPTLTEGNLRAAISSGNRGAAISSMTIPAGSGKYAAKFTVNTIGGIYPVIGVYDIEGSNAFTNGFTGTSDSVGLRMDGEKYVDGSSSSYGSSVSAGNTVEVELDMDNNTVEFLINGSAQGTISKTFSGRIGFMIEDGSSSGAIDVTAEFDYTPNDVNFKNLNTVNLTAPEDQGIDYFNSTLYTGNGTAIGSGGKAVTGVGFQPDWVWIKNRDAADDHALYDIARGVTKQWESNTNTTASTESEGLTTFGSDGFTVGNLAQVNTNTEDYVSWNWLASNSTSTTSPAGTIASTSSVASPGHFSVGTYTGNNTDNSTVGHGLGGIPEMIIVRNLNRGVYGLVWHTDGGGATHTADFAVTATFSANSAKFGGSDASNPTANVFKIGTHVEINADTESFVFYAFRSIPGVCKVGSYIGNGSSTAPPYVTLGFKPRWVMLKNISVARDWVIFDTARTPTNTAEKFLFPNLNIAEAARGSASGSDYDIDILSDAFRPLTGDSAPNGNGNTIIYMAMADLGGNGTLPPIYGR